MHASAAHSASAAIAGRALHAAMIQSGTTTAAGAGKGQLRASGASMGGQLAAKGGRSSRRATTAVAMADAVEVSKVEDKWIAGSVERCATGAGIENLRDAGMTQLAQARMPTRRIEEFRFTDLAPLVTATPVAADAAAADVDVSSWTLAAADTSRVVLIDGVYRADASDISGVDGVEVGMVSAGAAVPPALGAQTAARGGVLAGINAAIASDAVVINVPAGVKCLAPIHILQLSTTSTDGMATSAPRVVVTVGEGAEVSVVEEFACAGAGDADASYWCNGVCEMVLEKEAKVTHTMVQAQSRESVHTRATYLTQAEASTYALAEINVGGKLGRHDLGIVQLGPRTTTELSCFNLAGKGQCLDLHSSVRLDHEEGKTDQVHKCIVSSESGKGVFDGNVQVNKLAQRTDAGQISRNLLLVPKATVNVKPNLQIVADDVVCTHGCTVSDLAEEELFYIQSRGLSPAVARSLLVAGFGLEIVSKVSAKDLRERIAGLVRASLDKDNAVVLV